MRAELRGGAVVGAGDQVRLTAGRFRLRGTIIDVTEGSTWDGARLHVRRSDNGRVVRWWAKSCEPCAAGSLSRSAAEARYVKKKTRLAEATARAMSDADLIALIDDGDGILTLTRPEDS